MELIKVSSIYFASGILIVLLSGCATTQPPLYNWGTYQAQVNAHFKSSSSPEQQIAALERPLPKSARTTSLPPGYHAHLGLLYGEVGRIDDMKREFETEKALFPESAPFMDFMLTKLNKNKQGTL